MFYDLSSSGGCPPFLALKVLQGCDMCHDGQRSVPSIKGLSLQYSLQGAA